MEQRTAEPAIVIKANTHLRPPTPDSTQSTSAHLHTRTHTHAYRHTEVHTHTHSCVHLPRHCLLVCLFLESPNLSRLRKKYHQSVDLQRICVARGEGEGKVSCCGCSYPVMANVRTATCTCSRPRPRLLFTP